MLSARAAIPPFVVVLFDKGFHDILKIFIINADEGCNARSILPNVCVY
jgi:hypothetical protein